MNSLGSNQYFAFLYELNLTIAIERRPIWFSPYQNVTIVCRRIALAWKCFILNGSFHSANTYMHFKMHWSVNDNISHDCRISTPQLKICATLVQQIKCIMFRTLRIDEHEISFLFATHTHTRTTNALHHQRINQIFFNGTLSISLPKREWSSRVTFAGVPQTNQTHD